ncbi:MAG TPA: ABC transporter permease subunit [Cerasibacillus sp.]|uniref:ABC transporter permease n=1 Tax=Cerasibacillus sp. TaxID=2498711 RepID=UPI002F419EBA
MRQWYTIFQKEMLENWRNFKWVWVPLVILVLSIMDPITTYYMPEILDAVGNLPEGAIFEMPTPSPAESIMMSLSQLSTLGVLVIILMSMQTISGEIRSGVSEIILVKPVNYSNYVTAKWASFVLISLASLFIGLIGSWYYTNLLFGDLAFIDLLKVFAFYGLWFMFIISLSIFFNTMVKNQGLILFLTIVIVMVLNLLTSVLGKYFNWSPSQLSQHIGEMLLTNEITSDLMASAIITIAATILLLIISVIVFKSRKIAE